MCLAVPLRVNKVISKNQVEVENDGLSLHVSTDLLNNVQIGDYILVHAGFAIEKITQDEANETIDMLNVVTSSK